MAESDRTPLLQAEEGNLRKRSGGKPDEIPTQDAQQPPFEPGADWDPDLPYGGKVYLARKKKPDPLHVRVAEGGVPSPRSIEPDPENMFDLFEAAVVLLTLAFALYAYYYFDHLHYSVTRGYAHLGYPAAQHQIGQRFLHGLGVDKDQHHAMEWFKKASDQGHPHASYNLAVGHLQGIRTDILEKGDPHRLIAHAASKGVKEAHHALNEICTRGGCE